MMIIGKHTAAAEKNLLLSPFQITCGHRCRVLDSVKILGLKRVKRHDITRSGSLIGRAVLLEGDYHYCINGRGGERKGVVRIMVGESQMGMDASQITVSEYAAHADKLDISGKLGLFQIRVGTALGINKGGPKIRIGHLVIADNNVFFGGAVQQSCGYTPVIDPAFLTKETAAEAARFLEYWKMVGGKVTKDGKYLVNKNNPVLLEAMVTEAGKIGVEYHIGGCFSKDSLYGENLEHMVILGRKYRFKTSEMEQGMNSFIAGKAWHEDNVKIITGAVLAQIGECWTDEKGVTHGNGFPETPGEKKSARKATETAFRVAADALARMKEKLKQPLLY